MNNKLIINTNLLRKESEFRTRTCVVEKAIAVPHKVVGFILKSVTSSDFSMYLEMPYALQIYNTFRNRWCGAFFAEKGLKVIPTVNWSDEKSFDFCFKGIEKGSIVAVSTYMFHEHNNHSDQKDVFMKGYNRMLEAIEPSKIICYSEPFSEMRGDIIYIDYELNSWKYLNDEKMKSYFKHTDPVLTGMSERDIIYKTGYVCKGGGSAYGGKWIPKKEADKRFVGKPREIKTTYYKGYSVDTKIGDNGYAIRERHYTTAPNEKYHTNPHDHEITWEDNYPNLGKAINYWDGNVPEFKSLNYNYKMGCVKIVVDKFESITEIKESIMWGGEVAFRIKSGVEYGIFRFAKDDIILSISDCNKEGLTFQDGNDELHFTNVDDLLEYKLNGSPLKDILLEADITWRAI